MATQTSAQSTGFDPERYKETTRQQWQTAAEPWFRWTPQIQRWLGPSTELMLDLAKVDPGTTVLDIAAGAGEPAITAAKRVGPLGKVLATDISANILTYAGRAAAAAGLTNLETRVMDGESLDLPDASFDVVISRVGLIYFPDQQKALSEMRRVLKPGGRIAAIVYSTPDRNRFFSIPVGVIRRRAQLPPPQPGQPGPFSLGGPGVLEEAYSRAGFRNIDVRAVDAPVVMSSAAECVQFERESFGALHQMMSSLSETDRAETWAEIERELTVFETPAGFSGPCEMLVGVATN